MSGPIGYVDTPAAEAVVGTAIRITGWALEHYSYTPVFFGFGVLPLICAGILWAFAGPLERSYAGPAV